jgi:putative membrane protein
VEIILDVVLQSLLSGGPILLLHFLIAVAMLAAGAMIYQIVTPWHELEQIRAGNNAAALSFAGVLIGLAIPLAVAMSASVNAWDIIIFGAVAIILQLVVYVVADLMLKDLPRRIEDGQMSAAILLVAIKLSVSLMTAAAVSG